MDEPRDSATFRMVVAGLGLGLVVALAGICAILAFGTGNSGERHQVEVIRHDPKAKRGAKRSHPQARSKVTVRVSAESDASVAPRALWAIAAALAGMLVGLLLPRPVVNVGRNPRGRRTWRATNLPVAFLAIALALAVALIALLTDVGGSLELQCLVAAAGGCLAGIMIPTPAAGFDPE